MTYENSNVELIPLMEIGFRREAIHDHLAATALLGPSQADYSALDELWDLGMRFEGWRRDVIWLDLPPSLPATLDIYSCAEFPSNFRVVCSNRDISVKDNAGEVGRQEFRIDFRDMIDATIAHLPIPIANQPIAPKLEGEAAWDELQRILGVVMIDS